MFDYVTLVWLLPAAIAIHELEEWNILPWYQRNFLHLPKKSNASIRAFLIFVSLFGFVWTGLALITSNAKITSLMIALLAAIECHCIARAYDRQGQAPSHFLGGG